MQDASDRKNPIKSQIGNNKSQIANDFMLNLLPDAALSKLHS
jgi:hypothetical protein